ncbi:MAG: histidinol dehydrogenase [Deltaproteobacteria bacterium]|nr:MAG: histidinol dehydrogenase [Deltaproteobacteria bacterium]
MKIYSYPSDEAIKRIKKVKGRGIGDTPELNLQVSEILEDVKKRGDKALIEYTNKFDSPDLLVEDMEVSREEIMEAYNLVSKDFKKSLKRAVDQISSFHEQQKRNSYVDIKREGVITGQLINPVNAAGIYVPGAKGGETPLVSTVLMGGLPAVTAGVENLVMVTPPTKEGKVNPYLLVAAEEVGFNHIYKAGSAWAVAALAYGTETIPEVDVIAGPGNIYVTIAKKMVSGVVGIDMVAGPSEILVIADSFAEPEFIAADLLSQAEHDVMASSILVTPEKNLALKVREEVEKRLLQLPRAEIASQSCRDYGIILVTENLDEAFNLANFFAPEHLELMIENPLDHLSKIKNAGAVFAGKYTPEPVGDYIAGPNHVLPTGRTARFSSALSVDNFIKKTSLIYYSKKAVLKEGEDIVRLAEIEGLEAHAECIRVRMSRS